MGSLCRWNAAKCCCEWLSAVLTAELALTTRSSLCSLSLRHRAMGQLTMSECSQQSCWLKPVFDQLDEVHHLLWAPQFVRLAAFWCVFALWAELITEKTGRQTGRVCLFGLWGDAHYDHLRGAGGISTWFQHLSMWVFQERCVDCNKDRGVFLCLFKGCSADTAG